MSLVVVAQELRAALTSHLVGYFAVSYLYLLAVRRPEGVPFHSALDPLARLVERPDPAGLVPHLKAASDFLLKPFLDDLTVRQVLFSLFLIIALVEPQLLGLAVLNVLLAMPLHPLWLLLTGLILGLWLRLTDSQCFFRALFRHQIIHTIELGCSHFALWSTSLGLGGNLWSLLALLGSLVATSFLLRYNLVNIVGFLISVLVEL